VVRWIIPGKKRNTSRSLPDGGTPPGFTGREREKGIKSEHGISLSYRREGKDRGKEAVCGMLGKRAPSQAEGGKATSGKGRRPGRGSLKIMEFLQGKLRNEEHDGEANLQDEEGDREEISKARCKKAGSK